MDSHAWPEALVRLVPIRASDEEWSPVDVGWQRAGGGEVSTGIQEDWMIWKEDGWALGLDGISRCGGGGGERVSGVVRVGEAGEVCDGKRCRRVRFKRKN
jgi:hypothetical protein